VTFLAATPSRYALLPALVTAAVFLFAAPVYWRAVERPEDGAVKALENAGLYQRVYPEFHYGFGRLRDGAIPLWNETQHCGAPFLANPATGLFQPLNAVFLFLPTALAMAWHASLCLGLMGTGFALFARSLGIRYASALFGGATYAFSGTAAAAMSRPELANALACAPWLLWAVAGYSSAPRVSRAVLAGTAAALLLLCGSPAAGAALLLLAATYTVFGLVAGTTNGSVSAARKMTGLLLTAVIALGLAAVQWIPTLEWVSRLDAPLQTLACVDLAGQAPESPAALIAQTVSAGSDYLPRLGYFGIAALIVLPAALFHSAARRRAVFFAVAALCFAAASASGNAALRACFLPLTFCVAALAAFGADTLFQPGRDMRSRRAWAPLLLVWVAIVTLCVIAAPAALGRTAFLAIPFAVLFAARRMPAAVAMLALLAAAIQGFDLAAANGNQFAHPFGVAAGEDVGKVLTPGTLAGDGRFHVATRPTDTALSPNAGLLAVAPLAGGAFWPLTREEAQWWRNLTTLAETGPRSALGLAPDAVAPQLLNLMAVNAVVVPAESPFAEAPWPDGAVRLAAPETRGAYAVFVNATALPRACWFSEYRATPDFDAALALLADPGFDVRGACVVEGGASEPAAADAPQAAFLRCAIEKVAPEHLIVTVDAPRPGVVVLSESFAPGWRATRNGEPAPVLRANGLFLGAATPAGPQRIEFTYRPVAFTAGMTVSLITVAILAIAGATRFLRMLRHVKV